jgi:hypothetical protein
MPALQRSFGVLKQCWPGGKVNIDQKLGILQLFNTKHEINLLVTKNSSDHSLCLLTGALFQTAHSNTKQV